MKWNIEMTDTYGGEANYDWVRREEINLADNASDIAIVRAAKKAMGMSGIRCVTESYGCDTITIRPRGMNVILFATPEVG